MAGHSKWANIKHRKSKEDARKAKVFTKLIRELTIAARMGGGDVNSNPRLRLAMDKAFSQNMPKDTIQRAVKRGCGTEDTDNLEEIFYEGYGPNGVAVMVECLSDNRNRTVSNVRHAFSKCGGNLGTDGSVAYLFNKLGLIVFAKDSDEDTIMGLALEAGAVDVTIDNEGNIQVFTEPEEFINIKELFAKEGLNAETAEVSMIPSVEVTLDLNDAEKMIRLLDMLEELDDVQEVYSNANIPEDVLSQLDS
jgi:YebC/PmpR family DNA-binding regulatory protein